MESSQRIFCAFAAEAGTITESTDGFTAASFSSAPPSNYKMCGWMNAPQTDRGLNNSLGYSIGGAFAAYRKRGARNPTLSITLRGGGALDLLLLANRDGTTGKLPWLCFFVGVPGVWTEVYRFCKIGNIQLSANESPQGEAAEIEITLQIEATAVVASSVLNPSLATLRSALFAPLFWHDVRTFSINGVGMRKAIASFNAQINHNIERKNERNDWGDNSPLSNTNYELLEHNVNVSGEINLHDKLSESLLTTATRSQDWGNIATTIGDFEGTQLISLTLVDGFPQTVTGEGVEAGAQLSYTVPYMARAYTLTATSSGSGGGSGSGSGSG